LQPSPSVDAFPRTFAAHKGEVTEGYKAMAGSTS